MEELDDTDLEILRLLAEDARRPYSGIADAVDRSPPTVSDRVDRLLELGVIRRFTVDIDRSRLREGIPVLVDLHVVPGVEDLTDALKAADAVEHVFRTADAHVVCTMDVPDGDVAETLDGLVDLDRVREYDVRLLADAAWTPAVGDAAFAPDCAECDNTVTREGESARLGGDLYHFCCPSCKSRFVERYEELESGV